MSQVTHQDDSDAFQEVVFVIPAYQPDETLLEVVGNITASFDRIGARSTVFVVNDGSSPTTNPLFARLAQMPSVSVLQHAVNLGKGAALKTAFNQALLKYDDRLVGVVTADADGQHRPDDILSVANLLLAKPASLVIGSRSFDSTVVPLRSRLGNTITRWVFRLFTGRALVDTQSGLRGIPRAVLQRILRIPAQGYDYELEMLIAESQRGTVITQHPIATVYEPGNPTSHFNPLLDSAKIYYVFVRFSALSLAAAAIDYTIFLLMLLFSGYILISLAISRLITGIAYFHFARKQVFRSAGPRNKEAASFALLVIVSMFASYGLITLQVILLHIPPQLAKLVADVAMFAMNFAVQRVLVFRPRQV